MILVLSTAADIHARHVLSLLAASGHAALSFDTATLGGRARLSFPLGGTPVVTDERGDRIELGRARTVWMRRPRAAEVPASPGDPEVARFCRREWAETLDGLFAALPARMVNQPLAEAAAVKARQLAVARRVGLPTPDTLITSDPEAALAFVDRHDGEVIHKVQTSPRNRLFDTRAWHPGDAAELHRLALAPVLLQERIRGAADLRLTFVGGEIFAARIVGGALDSRLDRGAEVTPYALPAATAEALCALMADLSLVFGTIDLKLDHDGRAVFLEVNTQGQFLYIEIQTEQPISAALAAFLAREARAD